MNFQSIFLKFKQMKKTSILQNINIIFSVTYSILVGMCVEFMCRYLFFSYTRKDTNLPGIANWLLVEQVPDHYFPEDYTYIMIILIPQLLLLLLFLWSKINTKAVKLIPISIVICNRITTLFFFVYLCCFLYCIYIFTVPELLDPEKCSSLSSTIIRYIFIAILLTNILLFIFIRISPQNKKD